jgi:hypothetical protein
MKRKNSLNKSNNYLVNSNKIITINLFKFGIFIIKLVKEI